MEPQTATTPAPIPLDLSAIIRGLSVGESYLFPIEHKASVQSLCSRISKGTALAFKTKTEAGGVRVWRKPDKPAKSGT
jgi:hypothetical protein